VFLKNDIESILESKKRKFVGQHKFNTIKQSLKKILSEFGVVKVNIFGVFDSDIFSFGGECDKLDGSITVDFFTKNTVDKVFTLKESDWKLFKFVLIQNLQHELVHKKQFSSRPITNWYKCHRIESKGPFHMLEERVYLSDIDEIEAFAHDLALEIQFYYPGRKIIEILSRPSRFRKLYTYKVYKRAFGKTDWSNIHKNLLKKTYKWLSNGELQCLK
jgi:hypothetical protein